MSDTDPRAALTAALDQIDALVAGLRDDQATAATPCSDFDVAALVGHLRGVEDRVAHVLAGGHFAEVLSQRPSDGTVADWVAELRSLRARVDEVIADDEMLTREVSVPWGQAPAAAAIGGYVGELTVHAWDLARATGREDVLDPALAETALPIYHQILPTELPRGGDIPFGDVVDVPTDASAYDRLVAFTGRDPQWRP